MKRNGFVHHEGLIAISIIIIWVGMILPSVRILRRHEISEFWSWVLGVALSIPLTLIVMALIGGCMYLVVKVHDRISERR